MTDILQKKLAREKKARLKAEELLEVKSRELFESQQRVERRNKSLEEALAQLKETQTQLVQSEKMASLGTMAAGIAHEINNPVAFVTSNCSSLQDYFSLFQKLIADYENLIEVNQEKLQDCKELTEIQEFKAEEDIEFVVEDVATLLEESQTGLKRIKEIVAGLKEFTHLDESNFKTVDINKGLENTLNVIWNEMKYHCTVKKEFGKLPPVFCNPGELNQVFMNLLVNAAHATKEEKRAIIRLRTEVKGKYVEVSVADNGAGIPKENLDKLFNPFFTTKPVGKGTGLGLSISYGIVEKHSGCISVKSKEGVGTCFTVSLPIKQESKEEKQETKKQAA